MSSIEEDLLTLITKYGLHKYIDKFECGGVKEYANIIDIDQTKLRSYYHMLDADISKFENLRSKCIKLNEKGISMPAAPRHLDAPDVSLHDVASEPRSNVFESYPEPRSYVPRPFEERSHVYRPFEERSHVYRPFEERSHVPRPFEERSHVPRPFEERSHVYRPLEERSYVPRPLEERSYVPRPLEERSYVPRPFGPRLSYNPPITDSRPHNIQDGTCLVDYFTKQRVGEFRMEGSTAFIITSPEKIILEDKTSLLDYYSQKPVCELRMFNRTPYVTPVTNPGKVERSLSDTNIPQENLELARSITLYDRQVEAHKGLAFIIAYNHIEEDVKNRITIRDTFTKLFYEMDLNIVYINDINKTDFLQMIRTEITKAITSMRIFFIGIFSHRQDQDGAKVQLLDTFISLNDIFGILKENIPIEIPKVIIIQACQAEGLDTEMGAEYRLDMNKPYNASIMESNYLVVYSNVGALKDPKESPWYIHSLIRAYSEMQDQFDFYHVLVRANQLMLSGNSSPETHKQLAQIESTLAGHLYI